MSHPIEFVLDGERETTEDKTLTPNFIISHFAKKDPATNYLVQIKANGKEKESYQGHGEATIHIHEGMRFHIISTGPTPVSEIATSPLHSFCNGLVALGYQAEVLDAEKRYVAFDYVVETGPYAGRTFKHGIEVPQDFPLTPPSGPHICAVLHQTGQTGEHPKSNVNDSPFGNGWQYWSRPYADWAQSKQTVAAYLAHIFRLWDSQ